MAQVELKIYNPISYKITGNHRGLVLQREIERGMSMDSFLDSLQNDGHPVWKNVWNSETHTLGEDIIIVYNGKVLNNNTITKTSLTDGDVIGIRKVFHGG